MLSHLKHLLKTKPFAPFRLATASGARFDVIDRWQVAIGLTQLRYLFPRSDHGTTLPVDQIAALERLEELKQ